MGPPGELLVSGGRRRLAYFSALCRIGLGGTTWSCRTDEQQWGAPVVAEVDGHRRRGGWRFANATSKSTRFAAGTW